MTSLYANAMIIYSAGVLDSIDDGITVITFVSGEMYNICTFIMCVCVCVCFMKNK